MVLLRTIIVLSLLTLVPAIYSAYKLLDRPEHKKWRYLLLTIDTALWGWAMYLFFFGEAFTAQNNYTLGIAMSIIYACAFPQLAFITIHFITSPFKRALRLKWRLLLASLGSVYILFTIIYGYFEGGQRLSVVRYTYSSQLLPPSFAGFRIVQCSDLHLGNFAHHPGLIQDVVTAINNEKADLVVFTGDLVNFTSDEIPPYQAVLSSIRAKHGVIAILGNHDYGTYDNTLTPAQQANEANAIKRLIQEMGWKLLLNQNIAIPSGTAPQEQIYIAGTENETAQIQKANLTQTWANIPNSSFVLLLTHGPEYWTRVIESHNPALTLSGHIHGYQYAPMHLDKLLDIFRDTPSAYAYSNSHGHTLYISKGIGTSSIFPIRYGAWPEINVITLTHH